MPIKITTPSAKPPVGIDTALSHLRVDSSERDLVGIYLQAATEFMEDYTGRATSTKGYTLAVDRWPQRSSFYGIGASSGLYYGYGMLASGDLYDPKHYPNLLVLELRRFPLLAVGAVKYYAPDATELSTLDPSLYRVDTFSMPGRIEFNDSAAQLPTLSKRADAVQVLFTAGTGDEPATADPIMQMGILFLLTNWYENRVPISDRGMPLPFGLRDIMRNRRIDSMSPELR